MIRQEKNKMHPDWKGGSKIIVLDDMYLYIENPKAYTHTQLF